MGLEEKAWGCCAVAEGVVDGFVGSLDEFLACFVGLVGWEGGWVPDCEAVRVAVPCGGWV